MSAAKIDIQWTCSETRFHWHQGKYIYIYNNLVGIVNTIECTTLPLLSGYNATTTKFKRWHAQPEDHYTNLRRLVMKLVQIEKSLLRNIDEFQSNIENEWNHKAK